MKYNWCETHWSTSFEEELASLWAIDSSALAIPKVCSATEFGSKIFFPLIRSFDIYLARRERGGGDTGYCAIAMGAFTAVNKKNDDRLSMLHDILNKFVMKIAKIVKILNDKRTLRGLQKEKWISDSSSTAQGTVRMKVIRR